MDGLAGVVPGEERGEHASVRPGLERELEVGATGEARGKIAYNYDAPDLYDRRCSVIQAMTPQRDMRP